jgi:ATP-dependent DNA helicase RecG
LQSAIEKGEGKNVEYKIELPKSNTLAKTIIAFSNTGGGKLIIGVNDQGEVIGLDSELNIFEIKDKIASIIYETCYPTVLPDTYTTTIDEQLLLVIEVYRIKMTVPVFEEVSSNGQKMAYMPHMLRRNEIMVRVSTFLQS